MTALVPAGVTPIVAGRVPEAMIHGGAQAGDGVARSGLPRPMESPLSDFSAVLIGPGMYRVQGDARPLELVFAESPRTRRDGC